VKKPVLFLLNDRWAVKPANTSSTLMLACVRLGHPVFVTDVVHLQANSSTALFAEALELPMKSEIDSTKKLARLMGKAKVRRLPLADLEAVVIRTAPGKDISRSWAIVWRSKSCVWLTKTEFES
jgi:hypothetical protein